MGKVSNYIVDEYGVMAYAKKYLGKRFDVADKLSELDNPTDIIEASVKALTA